MRFFISSIFLGFLRKGTKVHLENAGGEKSAVRKVCSHFQMSSRLAGLGLSFISPISLSIHPRSAARLCVCVCVRCFPCCLLPTTRAVLVELLE